MDAAADRILRESRLAGFSVAVSKDGELLLATGYGMADLPNRRPATSDTIYRAGSIGKEFTASAVLKLAHEGVLSLDDDITKFITDYPARGKRITIRNLLTHTSGIQDYTLIPEFRSRYGVGMTRGDVVSLFSSRPLEFEPGTRYQYSNSGYLLAGLVVHKASGRPFGDYLTNEILHPAGLKETTYCVKEPPSRHRAAGYVPETGRWSRAARLGRPAPLREAPMLNMEIVYSAGAICSTVTDLLHWSESLRTDAVVPDGYRQMSQPTLMPGGTTAPYGLGLEMRRADSHPAVGHGGIINGFISQLEYFPEEDLDVAFLANTQPPESQMTDIWSEILSAVFDEPIRAWQSRP